MKNLIISGVFLLIMIGCSSTQSNTYSPRASTKIYTFNNISSYDIAKATADCFSKGAYKNRTIDCSTGRATTDTLFRHNGQAEVKSLKKYKSLSDTEGLILFYVRSTGGIFFNITLFVSAQITFDKYTGKITKVRALNGKTTKFSKSQDMIDSEPAFKVFKKGFDMMIKNGSR